MRAAVLVLVMCATSCSRTTPWSDVVEDEGGRTVVVERAVRHTFTGGELSQAFTRWPAYDRVRATNPRNGQKVRWDGAFGLTPVLIGFDPRKTYLVAWANRCDARIERFSIDGFPYVFLETSDGRSWEVVPPSSFPARLRFANLSSDWSRKDEAKGLDDVARTNRAMEFSTSMHFSREIPRSFAQWQYAHRDGRIWCR
jgi:hypothetical protein